MTTTPAEPQTPAPAAKPAPRGKKAAIVTVLVVILAYLATLFGYWWLSGSAKELEATNDGNGSETVVLVTLQALRTVDYKADAKVLVVPADTLVDSKLDVLKQDIAVRLHPWNSLGDLKFPAGAAPAEVTTTIDVNGDVNTWPFDRYKTEGISADLLIGEGEDRKIVPAKVEITGALQGWDLSSDTVAPAPAAKGDGDATQVIFSRALGPLAFDLGIVVVLLTLPTIAIFTSVLVISRRKQFQMPFATWYAAMLFAIVPLRNILPGAPPPGAWIDVSLVLWVIVALVAAMVMVVISWYKQVD
ncbi:DUF4436 domain-containing protein [Mycolicibacterium sp. P1-5]|uniref:DUF4436 domain-containing protein n=1 Tax=Mycolicibacterium sp. P1-5 TaxID=2024617 RepID=UPI0011EF8DBA|nr:DUF4436 domain-containing protein [Mycolicibacterium sp. P1-5]KAA0110144.1 DUF4436 domain-containing protein [Mycolicibacterium sp. P1-5]